MNTANFEQTGGYRFETGSLTFLQQAFGIFSALGGLAGDLTIISGCVEAGNNIGDGVVAIGGQLYRFRGSVSTADVRIFENVINRTFQNGQSRPVFTERWVGFGSGSGSYPWANFKRLDTLKVMQRALVPVDTITMYGGDLNSIPNGWFVCDGQNGTVDLRSRFVVGHDPNDPAYDTAGNTGGLREVALTENQMPSHGHEGTTSTDGSHTHSVPAESDTGGSGVHFRIENNNRNRQQGRSAGSHSHTLNINNAGGGEAHENRPPYYVMIFIQFKG